MTRAEALELLGLPDSANAELVQHTYSELYNDYQLRLTNAPTPNLKKLYQRNLQELKEAHLALVGSTENEPDLPSRTPVYDLRASTHTVEDHGTQVIKPTPRSPVKTRNRTVLAIVGVGSLLVLAIGVTWKLAKRGPESTEIAPVGLTGVTSDRSPELVEGPLRWNAQVTPPGVDGVWMLRLTCSIDSGWAVYSVHPSEDPEIPQSELAFDQHGIALVGDVVESGLHIDDDADPLFDGAMAKRASGAVDYSALVRGESMGASTGHFLAFVGNNFSITQITVYFSVEPASGRVKLSSTPFAPPNQLSLVGTKWKRSKRHENPVGMIHNFLVFESPTECLMFNQLPDLPRSQAVEHSDTSTCQYTLRGTSLAIRCEIESWFSQGTVGSRSITLQADRDTLIYNKE